MFCTQCGNDCREGARFCTKCGTELIIPSNKTSGSKAENTRSDRTDGHKNNKRQGLFSMKTQTCSRCGCKFEARLKKDFCPDCEEAMLEKFAEIEGSLTLLGAVGMDPHINDERFYDEVIEHRNRIMYKYRPVNGFSGPVDLIETIGDYRALTTEEAKNIYIRISNCSLERYGIDLINTHFIMPGQYPGAVVDFEDVFAVGYANVATDVEEGKECIICLFLTNDPYMPAFVSVITFGMGLFELKSKGGRAEMEYLYSSLCPNLTYPVQELKKLKKQIVKQGMVRGNMGRDFVLERIDDAMLQVGAYKRRDIEVDVPDINRTLLQRYGYLLSDDVNQVLYSKRKERKFWGEIKTSLHLRAEGF